MTQRERERVSGREQRSGPASKPCVIIYLTRLSRCYSLWFGVYQTHAHTSCFGIWKGCIRTSIEYSQKSKPSNRTWSSFNWLAGGLFHCCPCHASIHGLCSSAKNLEICLWVVWQFFLFVFFGSGTSITIITYAHI